MMKHLLVLEDRSCNASGFIYKALLDGEDMEILLTAIPSDYQTKSIDDAVDKLVTRVVKFKETRF